MGIGENVGEAVGENTGQSGSTVVLSEDWYSGTWSDTNTVTLIGTGFGSKSTAKPLLWAPFDSNLNPSNLGILTSWDSVQNMGWNSSEGYDGGGCAKAANDNWSDGWTLRVDMPGVAWNTLGQKMYLFRKQKRNFALVGEGGGSNWKIFRAWPNLGDNYPNWYMATSNGCVFVEGLGSGCRYCFTDNSDDIVDTWFQEEIITQTNTTLSGDNATLEYRLDTAIAAEIPYNQDGWELRGTGDNDEDIDAIYVVHGVEAWLDEVSSNRIWAADVYMDTTWQRVMIGNDPVFSDCTEYEIQIPSSWSSTNIGLTVNQGELSSLSGKYVFIIGTDNLPIQQSGNDYIGQIT